MAEKYGARYFDSPIDLLREVDAVTVATPTPFHFDLVMESFMAGVHVLIEKPMALTLEDCDAIIEVAERNGVKLIVGPTMSFAPAIRTASPATIPLIAMTGNGKSTLARAIMALEPTQGGRIAISGEPIATKRPREGAFRSTIRFRGTTTGPRCPGRGGLRHAPDRRA